MEDLAPSGPQGEKGIPVLTGRVSGSVATNQGDVSTA